MQEAFGKLARLDILVNNAGIGLVGNIEETERADFERLFRVNVAGLFVVTQAAMPKLLDATKGSIVNIGSVARPRARWWRSRGRWRSITPDGCA